MVEEILAEFVKCPNCGSEDSLMKRLVNEQIEKGVNMDKVIPCLGLLTGIALSPHQAPFIGQLIPKGTAILDMCLNCGTIFGIKALKEYESISPQQVQAAGQAIIGG